METSEDRKTHKSAHIHTDTHFHSSNKTDSGYFISAVKYWRVTRDEFHLSLITGNLFMFVSFVLAERNQ